MILDVRNFGFISLILILMLGMGCSNEQQKQKDGSIVQQSKDIKDTPEDISKSKVILFFGNSLTAGYGLDQSQAFPTLIQNRLDSLGLEYHVVNAGLSGETTAGGAGRIDWILEQQIDIFVLELGGNDMLRGLNVQETENNLRLIIERIRSKYDGIPIILAGMKAPPNMGKEYTTQFENIYPKLAAEYGTGLIPFFLENVGGIASLNLPDGIHPNEKGQKIVRDNVWTILKDYL